MSVHSDAESRGYRFDRSKLGRIVTEEGMIATDGQLLYEWSWLMSRLRRRNEPIYRRQLIVRKASAHPPFHVVTGPIARWEHVQ